MSERAGFVAGMVTSMIRFVLALAIMAAFAGAAFMYGVQHCQAQNSDIMKKALDNGAAEYVCNPRTGEVKLVWKNEKK